MGPRDLSYFLSLPYEIRIWENDGALTANIRELSLIATAPDAGAAVDALAIRKREYFESMIANGRADEIALPADHAFRRSFARDLLPFSFKLVAATVVVVLALLSIVPALKLQVRELGRDVRITAREIPRGLWDGLEQWRAIPPDRQERAVKSARAFFESVKPIIDEARAAFDDPPRETPPPKTEP